MNITLRDVTSDNWIECVGLTTDKNKRMCLIEEYVFSNALTLLESIYDKGWTAKAIYDGNKMVGLTLYGYCYENNFYEIVRLMIDYKHQGKGYGKAAFLKVIDEMKKCYKPKEIYLTFDPKNTKVKKMYEEGSFENTFKKIDGEILYRLKVE